MFGIGIGELIVVLIIAFVVVGPEKLPHIARTLGKGFHELRRATEGIRAEIEREDLFSDTPENGSSTRESDSNTLLKEGELKEGEEEKHGEAGRS